MIQMEDEIIGLKEKLKKTSNEIIKSDEYLWELSRLYEVGLIDSDVEPKKWNESTKI